MAKKQKVKINSIVFGHLEKIGAKVFDDYSNVITDLIRGHQGIYALYKKDRLYYVGLATNLKNRIKAHIDDKHKGKWTHFSLFIVKQHDHIKELESLILRIAYPKGNAIKGKLKHSKDLRPHLKRQLKIEWDKKCNEIIGGRKIRTMPEAGNKVKAKSDKGRPLKGIFPTGKVIYAYYKGKDYKAWVFGNGRIKFAGNLYNSPSLAGIAVTKKKTMNGWKFWKYTNNNGELVYIDALRKPIRVGTAHPTKQ